MKEAILMELNVEGSTETVSVEYQEYFWRDPEITDVKHGTISVLHLISPLQLVRAQKELNEHLGMPFTKRVATIMESFKLDRLMIKYHAGIMTPDEVRKELGVVS